MSSSTQLMRRANGNVMRELYDKMFESTKDYENPEIIDAILNLAADALLTQQTTLKRQEVLKKLMDLAEEISVS